MAHFAKLDENNVVVFVTVGRDEDDGKEAELTARTGDVYKQTSYNTVGGVHLLGGTPFRKNYAGIGYTYDPVRDAFIPPKPSDDATLDESTCQWIVQRQYQITELFAADSIGGDSLGA
jgi:hypothetical protein